MRSRPLAIAGALLFAAALAPVAWLARDSSEFLAYVAPALMLGAIGYAAMRALDDE